VRPGLIAIFKLAFDFASFVGRFPASHLLRHVRPQRRLFAENHPDQTMQRTVEGVEQNRAIQPNLISLGFFGLFCWQIKRSGLA